MGIDGTVANKWKAAAVVQRTPVWIIHAKSTLQQGGDPHPPGRDWHDLNPPRHATGEPVTGATTNLHRSENKQRRIKFQEEQVPKYYWKTHEGNDELPQHRPPPDQHRNKICPSGMAVHHPAYAMLL